MIIDLTEDSTSEEDEKPELTQDKPTPFNQSNELLARFTHRGHEKRPTSTSGKDSPFASTSDSSASRKRSRDEVATEPLPSLPKHHGLSPFYGVQDDSRRCEEAMYPKGKEVQRNSVKIADRRRPFRPSATKERNASAALLPAFYENKLAGIKGPQVSLSYKTRLPDFNFEFVNSYKLREGVERVDPSFDSGCECGDECDPRKCTCLSQEVSSDARIVPYKNGRNNTIVLRSDFLKRQAMIYECSPLCGCSNNCWNRVVQHGRTLRLEIFETKDRGFGLRSLDEIQSGQFVDCYLGEVISKKTAEEREAAMASDNSASYLFSLDFFSDDDDIYVVDGRKYGSPARFMNHSCNPNCKMFSITQHHADQKIFDMAFFALCDIAPRTELTFDYYPNWKTSGPQEVDPDAVKCLCGERNCRGQLWPNREKRSRTNG